MSTVPIYLVVGFLGAGKTTLLKRLVGAVEGRNFIFVVNEFSAVDVDAAQIENEGGVAMAVAGGSIFCRCLITEFVDVMRRISAGIPGGEGSVRPGGVVIEASGMADPRSMSRLLAESGLNREYHVAGVTAVVDPGVLMKLLLVLPNIKGQLQSADLILFNKTDLHSREMIENVTAKVQAINPSARTMECVRCGIDPMLILEESGCGSDGAIDAEYNKCRDPHFERDAVYFREKPSQKDLLELFAGATEGLYRAKGFVNCREGWLLIDWSEGGLRSEPAAARESSALTVIWDPGNEPALIARLRYLAL